ncbi:MAG: hypothetical protein ABJF01_06045 [bacterium]
MLPDPRIAMRIMTVASQRCISSSVHQLASPGQLDAVGEAADAFRGLTDRGAVAFRQCLTIVKWILFVLLVAPD